MPYITDTNRARARVFDRKKLHELLNGDILCLFPLRRRVEILLTLIKDDPIYIKV